MRMHATQCGDLHEDERDSTKLDQMVPLSATLKGVALKAQGGAEPSVEATMVPLAGSIVGRQ